MAHVTIAGNAVIITSTMKLDDIKTVEKYRPKALVLMGGDDGKEPIFKVGTGCTGSVNKYGITFADATRGENGGFATLTLTEEFCGDPADFVAEKYGVAIANLKALEATLGGAIEGIASEKQAVMDSITVIQ